MIQYSKVVDKNEPLTYLESAKLNALYTKLELRRQGKSSGGASSSARRSSSRVKYPSRTNQVRLVRKIHQILSKTTQAFSKLLDT